MKFSEQWLREWIDPSVDTQALAEQLTMMGLEVDGIHPAAENFSKVVVGHVLEAKQHPNADRLRVCQVDVGQSKPLSIVCGGVNVRDGLKVAVAVEGAVLPGDFKIKATKLRGEPSHGMICSSKELGMEGSEPSGGIMELSADAPIGKDLREYLNLDDAVIDIDLTPNRGDCLSVKGIAREVAVINQINLKDLDIKPVAAQIKDKLAVHLDYPEACPFYVGRVIKNINTQALTPVWLSERLRRGGIRTIHPVVDVCNYVMLELGQPMHAFDLSTLKGDVHVRKAQDKEKIKLIDETTATLTSDMLVVADDKQAHAIAGVMGGLDSAVNADTQSIFLEAAFFNPVNVCLTARDCGIQSDSSHRFERGVDYQLAHLAMERASALLFEIVGGEIGPVIEEIDQSHLPDAVEVTLRTAQIQRLLGLQMSDTQIQNYLQSLGMLIEKIKVGWRVRVPSYRFDITQEIDLIEELARVHGYDNIPITPMQTQLVMPVQSETDLARVHVANFLRDRGYHEAISYSFVSHAQQQQIDPELEPIALDNPINNEMGVMRTSLWPGLLQALRYNQHRQQPRVRLFEMGVVFQQHENEWLEIPNLALLLSGVRMPQQWGVEDDRVADFYDLKGDIASLLSLTRRSHEFRWRAGEHDALHPGQSALLYKEDKVVGRLGALHPRLVQAMELTDSPLLFEINLSTMDSIELPHFHSVSKFPAVRRDLALVIDDKLEAETIITEIKHESGDLLQNIQVFDVYQGQGVADGKKSIALGLTFQDPSRTLIDSEINELIQKVVITLERKFKVTLRA